MPLQLGPNIQSDDLGGWFDLSRPMRLLPSSTALVWGLGRQVELADNSSPIKGDVYCFVLCHTD